MHRAIDADEPVCLICGNELDPLTLICLNDCLCKGCKEQLIRHQKAYRIENRIWYVLYEYNDFLERLWFRYKEQRDIVLASIFLQTIQKDFFKSYCICGLPSSEKKRLERGFEPLKEVFESQNLAFYSPLYKESDWKQNKLPLAQRKEIGSILKHKEHYPLNGKSICLVDDVCTTGASMEAACSVLNPKIVFMISANPKWIERHKKEEVQIKRNPWK